MFVCLHLLFCITLSFFIIVVIYNFSLDFLFLFLFPLFILILVCGAVCAMSRDPHRDLPRDLCPVYRPGEWEQLPSERDLNRFSRYEALDPRRSIVLDDIETTLPGPGNVPCSLDRSRLLPLLDRSNK